MSLEPYYGDSEAFRTSSVVTAQPMTGPHETTYQDTGSLVHGHLKHVHHTNDNHSDLNLAKFFTCLFKFFPFYVVHAPVA